MQRVASASFERDFFHFVRWQLLHNFQRDQNEIQESSEKLVRSSIQILRLEKACDAKRENRKEPLENSPRKTNFYIINYLLFYLIE